MKCQALFSLKKSNQIKMPSVAVGNGALGLNAYQSITMNSGCPYQTDPMCRLVLEYANTLLAYISRAFYYVGVLLLVNK